MADDPSVAAVVLHWNNFDDTSSCLRYLSGLEYPELDVIVVDNGSTDDSPERLWNEFTRVDFVSLDSNYGFSKGMNAGIRNAMSSDPDYVWLLNNDIQISDEGLLGGLVKQMEANKSYGVITPRILTGDGSIWFERGFINWQLGRHGHETVDGTPRVVCNDYVPNCCALYDSSVFSSIGMVPEEYFIYCEDLDLGTQIREAGFLLVTDLKRTIVHHESSSSGGRLSPTYAYYMCRNELLFARKYDRYSGPTFVVMLGWWITKKMIQMVVRSDFDSMWAIARGFVDGLRRKEGRGPYP